VSIVGGGWGQWEEVEEVQMVVRVDSGEGWTWRDMKGV
jgi:hypothetical protein